MNIVNDLTTAKTGDTVVTIIPQQSKYAPAVGSRYSMDNYVIGEVVECEKTALDLAVGKCIAGIALPPITIIKDGERIVLSAVEIFKRLWDNNYPKSPYETNPSVYILTFKVTKTYPRFYNAQTGFYDYSYTYME